MRPKLSDVLISEIRRDIAQGQYGMTGRLPSEAELCQRFGVSRPIVREALKELRDEGLIHSRQGAGSFVNGARQDPGLVWKSADVSAPPVHSIADVRRVYEYRIAMEGEIAFAAASNANTAAIGEIKQRLDEIQAAIHRGAIGVDQDFDFHLTIARATDNPLFIGALEIIKPHLAFVIDLARSFSSLGTAAHVGMVQEEHAAVYEAVASRNPDAARTAMRRHITAARDRVFNGVHIGAGSIAVAG